MENYRFYVIGKKAINTKNLKEAIELMKKEYVNNDGSYLALGIIKNNEFSKNNVMCDIVNNFTTDNTLKISKDYKFSDSLKDDSLIIKNIIPILIREFNIKQID